MAATKKPVSAFGLQILFAVSLIAVIYWLTTLEYKSEYEEIDRGFQAKP